GGEGNNRNEELGDITRGLKLMARDLDVPVILLSQLSRKCVERTDKRPILSDLRESGAIEQDADVVAMIYRDDYYNASSPYAGLAELLVRKNRMGECGNVQLVFQPEFSRFRDADRVAIAEAAQRAHEARPVRQKPGFNE
ncbi:MAG: DnaB-like helicase C-terminal domain-containing protein, partial [Proteobacteria bacterium]|nr:DnaB-like helicase C-terminal domain-containing protein [Pseudomonadota bacterium]